MRDEIKLSEIEFDSGFKISYDAVISHRCQTPFKGKRLVLESRSFEIMDIVVGNKSCLISYEHAKRYPNFTSKELFHKNILEYGYSDIIMDAALVCQGISIKVINRGDIEKIFKARLLGISV